jgi:hypothetical protein
VKFQGFLQIRESFLFGFALARDVEVEALRDVPGAFLPDGRGEWAGHKSHYFIER